MRTRSTSGGASKCRFFFSSRRRHTRCSRDWSSDVCSSDLDGARQGWNLARVARREETILARDRRRVSARGREIGRASCRERVQTQVVVLPEQKTHQQVELVQVVVAEGFLLDRNLV